jgi:hypothetical protein
LGAMDFLVFKAQAKNEKKSDQFVLTSIASILIPKSNREWPKCFKIETKELKNYLEAERGGLSDWIGLIPKFGQKNCRTDLKAGSARSINYFTGTIPLFFDSLEDSI